ncbi:glycosyltransferase [Pseudomonas sp. MH9.2]|uniref:glycosyltransferase n=1 Tax=unclassified Pseudomonas TaxID=196821 RepID=UPI002AC93E9E|nr:MULTISPECIES: glycosyltransferase [unclassified Pseudomonas]MEB0028820.1 glycosyltransferase [Pseudomonas sp. MH9.2]MEE3509526.1 glycosyltransferase [Pseudomonas sp. 10C3]WPX68873.1 glycosyltransferase [Pseudomonas sp. MH9.2]
MNSGKNKVLRSESKIMDGWDNNKPLVSVLCLTYNHASFIEDAICGFLKQSTKYPFQIVFHDDASTDKTQELILGYKKKYPRIIKLVFQDVNIYSCAGNVLSHGMTSCDGKYIAFCEGDDYWVDSTKLQEQVDFLENNLTYSVVYSDCQPFDEFGDVAFDYRGVRRDLSADQMKESPSIYTLTSCFRNIITVPPEAAMAKYGDLFIWSLLGHHGKGKYLPTERPSRYRVHSAGLHSKSSRSARVDMSISTYAALMSYYKRVGNSELASFFRKKLLDVCTREWIRYLPGGEAIYWLRSKMRLIFKD